MNLFLLYGLCAVLLFCIGLHGFLFRAQLIRRIVALNIMSSGAFLLLISIAERNRTPDPDPVPQAMVLTGIVVSISVTALALALSLRVFEETGDDVLPEEHDV